ncbi:saccharopine dehydrogenase family protein [Paenibacillus wenxiniae]|uniref:Saccharopine dehydrogenase NADP-binding domain-containing protein n=1 Tax=Paenibacillus wenxiniae TaxID=1636843 RepID=A0ABW4RE36_9BACL
MIRNQIIIVGGYGTVGQRICRRLLQSDIDMSYEIVIAGRNEAAAHACRASMEGRVQSLQWDVMTSSEQWPDVSAARLIIMCLDLTETTLIAYCLEQGIDYIDITANGEFLQRLEQLKRDVLVPSSTVQHTPTILLSVGLAPGLTNLLAAELCRRLDDTEQLDISIMLGLGERHGQAAIRWTVDQLAMKFTIMEKGKLVDVYSLTDGRLVSMQCDDHSERATESRRKSSSKTRSRTHKHVYRFPFSDQQTLAHTLAVPSVSTRLGFDSVALTRLLAMMQRLGIFRLMHLSFVKKAIIALFGSIHAGSDQYAIRIDASGVRRDEPAQLYCVLNGHSQSTATAEIAALSAERLLQHSSDAPHGILHIEEWLGWDTVKADLKERLAFQMSGLDG